jgi:flagellin
MSISILNNTAALSAQNQIASTQASLKNTLFQLSSGSRINSGADDAAGLAIADGLHANISALSQSGRNASDGIGMLQVADGALSQVTTLLNRAVTLATEASTSTVSSGQRNSINAEFTQIKAEIDRIGTNTTFNGTAIFSNGGAADPNAFDSATAGLGLGSAIADGETFTITDTNTGKSFAYTAAGGTGTVGQLITAINTAASNPAAADHVNVSASLTASGNLEVRDVNGDHSLVVGGTSAALGAFSNPNGAAGGSVDVFLSDGGIGGSLSTSIGQMSSAILNLGATTLAGADGTAAQSALAQLNTAVQSVASQRGTIGAGINRLQSASNVMTNQVQNLTSAEDGIRSADVAQTVANMTKFNILSSTGMSALSQANQMQQGVLSLLRG